jgi:hypothetical protein
MTVGFNLSRIRDLHPADEVLYWLVARVADTKPTLPQSINFAEVKNKLHKLYEAGYEAGREDAEQTVGEWHKPLGV